MAELTTLSVAEQVATHLREEILRGRWSGTVPGRGELAKQLGMNPTTLETALRLLEKEGLLVGQGAGRKRRIVLPRGGFKLPALRVALMIFEPSERGADFMIELRHLLEEAGHVPFFPEKTLLDLGQDPKRVARFVRRTKADAWVVTSASREVLEWFATHETPAFALFGRYGGVPVAGARPDKSPSFALLTRRLLELGHRRISFLCRRQLRLPKPGKPALVFLKELEDAGIATGSFHLPDWQESRDGFRRILDSLFRATPPTALILDEAFLFHSTYHYLAQRELRIPQDVSLVCTDDDPGFDWCEPSVAHIRWNYQPIMARTLRWANNVARGKEDHRQTMTKADFVEGGTIGPAP